MSAVQSRPEDCPQLTITRWAEHVTDRCAGASSGVYLRGSDSHVLVESLVNTQNLGLLPATQKPVFFFYVKKCVIKYNVLCSKYDARSRE